MDLVEAAVLASVYKGVNNPREIRELLRGVDPSIVESTIKKLVSEGVLEERVEGFWIFKSRRLRLTRAGVSRAEEAFRVLKEKSATLERAVRSGSVPESEAWLLPFLAALGLLLIPMALPYEEAPAEEGEDVGADVGEADWIDL